MQLRPYQTGLINKIRLSLKSGHRSIVSVLGCGGGKSVIQGTIAASANRKGNRVLFLVHRRELCEQIRHTFDICGATALTDVCMVQTASRHIDTIQRPEIIITDEAHHSTANTYRKIYNAFPNALLLGFTATPIRLNRGGLGEVYTDLITSVSTRWLIDHNYLAPYRYYSASLADTSGLHVRAGEYNQSEIAALMDNRKIYGSTVKQWERFAQGKKTIVYCSSVETSEKTAAEFRAAGYSAASLDGSTNGDIREHTVEAFRRGEITVLCNCELFGEGFDVPDCECTVLLRPTMSLTLYIQQSMRSMRYQPGKTAVIIDHVGNAYRHGLPDDPREWSLEPKKVQETAVKIRECKNCFAVFPPTAEKCPFCGMPITHEKRCENRKVQDVDLVELKRQDDIRAAKYGDLSAETWADVEEIRQARGYKIQWAIRYAVGHGIAVPSKYGYMRRIIGI